MEHSMTLGEAIQRLKELGPSVDIDALLSVLSKETIHPDYVYHSIHSLAEILDIINDELEVPLLLVPPGEIYEA
jgi:hypothetical protein